MRKFPSLALLALAALVLSLSCKLPTDSKPPATVSIDGLNVGICSSPDDWWIPVTVDNPNLTYNFYIRLGGSFQQNDIEYARIYFNNGTDWWTLDMADYNAATKEFDCRGYYIGTGTSGTPGPDDKKELPIGTLRAVVRLSSGVEDEFTFEMGVPGSLSAGTKTWIYNSDDEPSGPVKSGAAIALKRPTGLTISNSSGTVSLTFQNNDNRTNNGYAIFYNSSGSYVGETDWFKDATNTLLPSLGGSFNTGTGQSNTLALHSLDNDILILNTAGLVFNDISRCRIILVDGSQYSNPTHFDYLTISTKTP